MDTMSLKEIQSKLLLWESSENPLAPLTADQREAILDLESEILGISNDLDDKKAETEKHEETVRSIPQVDTTFDFLEWYESLCENNVKADDGPYEAYHRQLEDRRNECVALNDQIGATMSDLNKMTEQYNFVSNKTNALHLMSEQLLADQTKLSSIGDDIKQKLHYFTQVEHLSQRLNSPTMSVNSETFFIVLAKIDECLDYMRTNNNFKESHTYLVKYRHLQNRAISLIRSYSNHILDSACDGSFVDTQNDGDNDTAYANNFKESHTYLVKYRHLQNRAISLIRSYSNHILDSACDGSFVDTQNDGDNDTAYANNFKESHTYLVKYRHLQNRAISLIRSYSNHILDSACDGSFVDTQNDGDNDTAYAVYFGRFQAIAPKLSLVIKEIERRVEKNVEYAALFSELQRAYVSRRWKVSGEGGSGGALRKATAKLIRDHCTLTRTACALLAHACRDECALYQHVFGTNAEHSEPLQEYLQSLCNVLYETLRPQIIHINHLETLAELCIILRVEVIEEQVNNDSSLAALGECARSLLQDAQERLVFRAHVLLRQDVLHYHCAPGDLAYPAKLLMMEQIALSIQQEQALKRSDSRNSMVSDISASSQEVANINNERRPQASPADLHGMWYPGVRRTLAALSRLYRCLEKKVFQGLAQEAISLCVQSVDNASNQITHNTTSVDGELFQIKHLLILREQIAPFQVDFIIKETTLDFSNVKNAAYGLIQRPRQIFSLNSNNALLEFLLEGTPMVREHLLDSRKEVDRQLKSCCETFIKDATDILAGPMIGFLEKATAFTPIEQLKSQPWATPEEIATVVKEAQKRIKLHLAPLQRSMQLYLANKETEFILFRPIRNNVVGYFIQVEQLLTNAGYTTEDTLIVACPTAEQVSVFISSASLISHSEPVQPYGVKVPIKTVVRKPSVSTVVENEKDVSSNV